MAERKTGCARIYALYADPDCLLVGIESGEWCQDGYKRQILDKLVAESGSIDSIYEHNNLYTLSYSKRALERRAQELTGEWLKEAEEKYNKLKELYQKWGGKV